MFYDPSLTAKTQCLLEYLIHYNLARKELQWQFEFNVR